MTADQWDAFAGTNGATPQFNGFEIDQTMLRISAMNLMLHGVDSPDVRYLDSISQKNAISSKSDVIFGRIRRSRAPLTWRISIRASAPLWRPNRLSFCSLLCSCACSSSVAAAHASSPMEFCSAGAPKAYRQLRQQLVEDHKLEAIIYLPSGVFKPYSGVSTAILVFTKTNAGGTDNVWLYNMEADGYTLDDKRDPDEKNNDIPDIIERWANLGDESERERTEKSFLVPQAGNCRQRVRLQLQQVHQNRVRAY